MSTVIVVEATDFSGRAELCHAVRVKAESQGLTCNHIKFMDTPQNTQMTDALVARSIINVFDVGFNRVKEINELVSKSEYDLVIIEGGIIAFVLDYIIPRYDGSFISPAFSVLMGKFGDFMKDVECDVFYGFKCVSQEYLKSTFKTLTAADISTVQLNRLILKNSYLRTTMYEMQNSSTDALYTLHLPKLPHVSAHSVESGIPVKTLAKQLLFDVNCAHEVLV